MKMLFLDPQKYEVDEFSALIDKVTTETAYPRAFLTQAIRDAEMKNQVLCLVDPHHYLFLDRTNLERDGEEVTEAFIIKWSNPRDEVRDLLEHLDKE